MDASFRSRTHAQSTNLSSKYTPTKPPRHAPPSSKPKVQFAERPRYIPLSPVQLADDTTAFFPDNPQVFRQPTQGQTINNMPLTTVTEDMNGLRSVRYDQNQNYYVQTTPDTHANNLAGNSNNIPQNMFNIDDEEIPPPPPFPPPPPPPPPPVSTTHFNAITTQQTRSNVSPTSAAAVNIGRTPRFTSSGRYLDRQPFNSTQIRQEDIIAQQRIVVTKNRVPVKVQTSAGTNIQSVNQTQDVSVPTTSLHQTAYSRDATNSVSVAQIPSHPVDNNVRARGDVYTHMTPISNPLREVYLDMQPISVSNHETSDSSSGRSRDVMPAAAPSTAVPTTRKTRVRPEPIAIPSSIRTYPTPPVSIAQSKPVVQINNEIARETPISRTVASTQQGHGHDVTNNTIYPIPSTQSAPQKQPRVITIVREKTNRAPAKYDVPPRRNPTPNHPSLPDTLDLEGNRFPYKIREPLEGTRLYSRDAINNRSLRMKPQFHKDKIAESDQEFRRKFADERISQSAFSKDKIAESDQEFRRNFADEQISRPAFFKDKIAESDHEFSRNFTDERISQSAFFKDKLAESDQEFRRNFADEQIGRRIETGLETSAAKEASLTGKYLFHEDNPGPVLLWKAKQGQVDRQYPSMKTNQYPRQSLGRDYPQYIGSLLNTTPNSLPIVGHTLDTIQDDLGWNNWILKQEWPSDYNRRPQFGNDPDMNKGSLLPTLSYPKDTSAYLPKLQYPQFSSSALPGVTIPKASTLGYTPPSPVVKTHTSFPVDQTKNAGLIDGDPEGGSSVPVAAFMLIILALVVIAATAALVVTFVNGKYKQRGR